MTHSKWLIAMLSLGAIGTQASAEPQRTVFTVENQFPRWEQVEAGARVRFVEATVGNASFERTEVVPYLRYGIREHIAVQVGVPVVDISPDRGSSETGLGDIEATFQLRAYEDIFGYPYFIPHLTVTLPTGDEDKGLGAGDPVWTAGISYGNKLYSHISWVLDARYRINPNSDNQAMVGSSLLWHVSPELDFLLEGRWMNNTGSGGDSSEVQVLGGMVYNWTRDLQMGVHAGSGSGDTDALGMFRLSYNF
ncbi:MAG: transporter [Verrucomicrobia bacterium]|nr:transporter [Verrucomicrobiota bacterium]MCH8513519.1 transporter [Kiritimatiellia bacterium]